MQYERLKGNAIIFSDLLTTVLNECTGGPATSAASYAYKSQAKHKDIVTIRVHRYT